MPVKFIERIQKPGFRLRHHLGAHSECDSNSNVSHGQASRLVREVEEANFVGFIMIWMALVCLLPLMLFMIIYFFNPDFLMFPVSPNSSGMTP